MQGSHHLLYNTREYRSEKPISERGARGLYQKRFIRTFIYDWLMSGGRRLPAHLLHRFVYKAGCSMKILASHLEF